MTQLTIGLMDHASTKGNVALVLAPLAKVIT
jgi:hypothetical protein